MSPQRDSRGPHTGWLLSAETQLQLAAFQSWIAYRTARQHAAAGSTPEAAAAHGALAGPLTAAWWLLVLPPTLFSVLVTLPALMHPGYLIWEAITIYFVVMQRVRLCQWRDRPIGTPQATPSGMFFAAAGAVWFYGSFMLLVLAAMVR